MIVRIVAAVVLAWLLGFAAFVVALPGPATPSITDAIVVPTGGPGRIARGGALLRDQQAKRMLISGVGVGVGSASLARENALPRALFACCIDLDHEAGYTRDNADETVKWLRAHRFTSVRLVTTDWHMPRARFELARASKGGVTIVVDAIASRAEFSVLMLEYNKYLLRRIAAPLGL